MTTILLIAVVALEGLIGAVLHRWTDVRVDAGSVAVICALTFFVGLIPAVEVDSRFPWCPRCHGPWTGRRVSGRSSAPEPRVDSVYDSSKGSFEKRSTTVYRGSATYTCTRCTHRFIQSWRIRQPSG